MTARDYEFAALATAAHDLCHTVKDEGHSDWVKVKRVLVWDIARALRGLQGDPTLYVGERDALEALRETARAVLPDLDHYVSTHGPGPDKRRDALRAAIDGSKP